MTSAVSDALPRLHRYAFWTQIAGLLVMIMGAALLATYVDATLVGLAPEKAGTYQGHPVPLLSGLLFVAFGAWGALRTGRHVQRLLRIVKRGHLQPMRVRLRTEKKDDSTTHYALLLAPEAATPLRKIRLWFGPTKALTERLNKTALPCTVYIDPATENTCVIEVEGEVLWPLQSSA
ncbi:MAG: hypothetical protein ACR2GR_02865 [Rhodothermales bacterium]